MKAAIWYGPYDIRVIETPSPPKPGPGEIQITVNWAGICGTDLHEYVAGPVFIPWEKPHPLTGHVGPTILGHEVMGRVVDIGPGVEGFSIKDRIVPDVVMYCGHCPLCKQGKKVLCRQGASLGLQTATGGFGEYVNMPAYMAYKLPLNVPDAQGAMIEPLATAIRAVRQGRISLGDRVMVIGGGAIGFFAFQVARLAGAREVYMITRGVNRLKIAKELGSGKVIDAEGDPLADFLNETGGIGADLVLDCAGTESSTNLALQVSGPCSRIVLVGIFSDRIKMNANEIVFYDKEIIGSLGRYEKDMETAIDYLEKGLVKIEPLITKKIRLDDIVAEGFETLVNEKGKHVKILVTLKGEQ